MTIYEPSGPEVPGGTRGQNLINNWMINKQTSERLHHPGEELVSEGFPPRIALGHRTLNYLMFSYSELIRYLQEKLNFFNSYDFVCKSESDLQDKVIPALFSGCRIRIDTTQKINRTLLIAKSNISIEFKKSSGLICQDTETAFRVEADRFQLSGCHADCKYLAKYTQEFSFSALIRCSVPDLGQSDYWLGSAPALFDLNTSGIIFSDHQKRHSIYASNLKFGKNSFRVSEDKKFLVNDETISVKGDDGKDGAPGADGKDGKDGKDGRDGKDRTGLTMVSYPYFKKGLKSSWHQPISIEVAQFEIDLSESNCIKTYAGFYPKKLIPSLSSDRRKVNFQIIFGVSQKNGYYDEQIFSWEDKDQNYFSSEALFIVPNHDEKTAQIVVAIKFPAHSSFMVQEAFTGTAMVNCQPGVLIAAKPDFRKD